jgi:decaprenylphospho-beta-D-erythro-pentofuranosid-2-ulose 2-reductase
MTEPKTLLLVGATSDIGHAVARRYAEAGWRILLAARDPERARRNAEDLAARTGNPAPTLELDIQDHSRLPGFIDGLPALPDTVVCVVGELGDQKQAERDPVQAARLIDVNFTGPALLLGLLAERFAARGSGTIVGVSSVAGDRGRASNYLYGAAKAGFTAFLSGLRNRLAKAGIRVVTVKPGFVRTRMTEGMKLPGPLTAAPEEVATAMFRAAEQGRGDVIYVRPVWRLIMTIIGAIPERMFKRLKL